MAISDGTLRWLNAGAALLHLTSAIVILAFDRDWKAPVYIPYAKWEALDPAYPCFEALPDGRTNTCLISQERVLLGKASLKAETVAFFLLSFFFQGLTVLPGVFRWYIKLINSRYNVLRWLEYSISASLMGVIIGHLNGIDSFWTLLLIFTSLATTMLLGLAHEHMNALLRVLERSIQPKKTEWPGEIARAADPEAAALLRGGNAWVFRWACHLYGWIPYLGTWAVLAGSFFYSINKSDTDPPAELAVIIYSLFFSFTGFAVNQIMQYAEVWKWKDYRFGELSYIVLSYTSKSILAWTLFTGVWFRDGRVEAN